MTEGDAVVHDEGDGATGAPQCSECTDQNKGNENIFHGFHTGKSHGSHFPDGMLFEQAISEEKKKAKYQGNQNGNIIPDAEHKGHCKQGKNADFNHISYPSENIAFYYTPSFPGLQIKISMEKCVAPWYTFLRKTGKRREVLWRRRETWVMT